MWSASSSISTSGKRPHSKWATSSRSSTRSPARRSPSTGCCWSSPTATPPAPSAFNGARLAARTSLRPGARVDVHDLVQELDGLVVRPLEGVAPLDRAEAAAQGGLLVLLEHFVDALGRAAREDHDAAAGEGALDHVGDALGERVGLDAGLLHHLACRVELDVRARWLDLDDVCTELGGDLRRVGTHVDGGLALLAEPGAPRVAPDYDHEAGGLGLECELAQLLVHLVAVRGTRVDGETDGGAAEPQGILDAGGHGRDGIGPAVERIRVVGLEDEGHLAGELGGAGLDEAERRRVGVAARVDGQLEVVARVVAGGVGREAARRAVLEALVDRQHDELAGAGEAPVVEHPVEVGERAGVVRRVPAQYLLDSICHLLASVGGRPAD